MKNKEIEELINDIKKHDYKVINKEDYILLLSYIEQLEKRNKELYEGFMATQEELTDYATKNEQLEKLCNKYEQEHKTTFETWKEDIEKLEQLENNRNKAVREIINMIENGNIEFFKGKKLENILMGGSDE